MGQEFDLPEGFTLAATWPKSTDDKLFQSIIKDAIEDLGWRINRKRNTIIQPIIEHTYQRKELMQHILDSRVLEQQVDPKYKKTILELKPKVWPELLMPEDFPESTEKILELFSEITIEAVVTPKQKEIFKYLRHSWRIPYNTTPGRTLSFIVRVGSEGKVAGIFTLASPTMWMSSRDEALGFENFDVLKLQQSDKQRIEEYISNELLKKPGMEKEDSNFLRLNFKQKLQRSCWINRWRKNGLVDDSKEVHHLSGKFSVSDLLNSCKEALKKRILQFPINEISDEENFAGKCKLLGISIKSTKPTNWVTGTEPVNNSRQIKNSEKRRRIVRECLEAFEVLHKWEKMGFPASVEGLFESLHQSDESLGGERINALKKSILELKTLMISSNIAELIICGSIPPFNSLRVGKLVAMLALSSETKSIWDSTYSTSSSDIATELAGRPISKPATLSAITTTGLYGRSNAQYDRISIPMVNGTKVRFALVGVTGNEGKGPSNLMISNRSWKLVRTHIIENKITGTSGKFGEGTSARIRRLQSSIRLMNKQVTNHETCKISELLNNIIANPFSRSIHVANLSHNSVRFHLGIDKDVYIADNNLDKDKIVNIWIERWLTPLLSRKDNNENDVISKVLNCDMDEKMPPFGD